MQVTLSSRLEAPAKKQLLDCDEITPMAWRLLVLPGA